MSRDFDLRLGEWQTVLADVGRVDSVIVDPPYGKRTHEGHDAGVDHALEGKSKTSRRRKLSYDSWTPDDVREFVEAWSPRCRGWFAAMSCSDLAPVWREELERAGRCTFAPIPCVIWAMTVRLSGDGPSSWAVWLNVARPRSREMASWGTLPGAYAVDRDPSYIGGKPIELMQAIIRDYTRPGDLVCDPCAGNATTGVAARQYDRRFIGAEAKATVHAVALERLGAPVQMDMFSRRRMVIGEAK